MKFFSGQLQGRIPAPGVVTFKLKLKFFIRTFSFLASGMALAYGGWKWVGQNQPLALMAGGPSGSVFRDYNGDGLKQSGEPLVAGVTVNAYDASGSLCATTVSTASNTSPNYMLPMGCSGAIRIEFEIGSLDDCLDPGIDFTALNGAAYGSSVQFVDASSMSPVNFGLYNPADYNRGPANTKVFIPCYTTGDPLVSGTSRAGAWFLGFPYNNTGTAAKSNVLTGETIGSTWGVAYSEQAKVIFTSAFLKRHVGLGVMGSGGIYKLVPTPTSFTAASFYDMDANGHRTRAMAGCLAYGNGSSFTINAAPGTEVTYNGAVDPLTGLPCGLGVIGTNAQRGLVGDKASKSHDPAAFDQVGKVSLGDLEISDDGLHLFVTNLYNRYVYRLTLNDASNPTSVVAVDSFALPAPTPSVTNGVLRPFATKYQRGKLYIGALSTGENGGVNMVGGATDMNAYVFELANANTAPSLTAMSQALTYPLNYLKGPSRRDMTGINRGEKWNPWTRNNGVSLGTSDYRTYPTPMLTDLEFTERGDLVMAFTDRSGHQWGWFNDRNFTGSVLINYIVGGDILMAGVNCNTGAYTLENNGSFTSSGLGFTTNTVVAAPNVNGVGNMDGPGGGEFFDQELYNPYHDETDQGALAVLPGDNKVINTIMDPLGIFEGGTVKFSTLNGDESHRYRLFENSSGNFGKANGLGDLELDGLIPPLEIGNRVWFDTDMDGVQDPGEAPIANVTVELYDGMTLIGTDVTDANGNYYFDTLNVADGNQFLGGNQKGPQPNRTYTIRIGAADWTAGAGTGDLTGYVLTSSNAGGAGQPDVRDNDGVLSSMIPTISYTTGGPGENDHTLDFGFILADEPIVDLALRKTIDSILQDGTNPTALNNGDTVKFKIQLFNQGELGMDSLNVTDYLPAGFTFVNATGTGQVNEGWDGTDPNNPVYKWRSNTGSGGGGSLTTAQTLPLTTQTGDGVSSLSFIHNPGTGSNRLLILGIAVGNDGGMGEPPTVTSAQFQSGNLDFVGTVQSPGAGGSNDNDVRIYIYKQNNPTGSGNIDIILSGSGDISAQAVTFNGVNLSNPLGAFQTSSGLTGPVSAMFSASSGQVLYSMFGIDGGTSATSTGGQISIFNGSTDEVTGAAVFENGPNPTTSFTLGGNQDWALGAVPINVYTQPPFNPGDTLELCIYTTLEHVPGSPSAADFTNFSEISYARDTNGVNQSANDIDSPLNNNPNDNAGGQQGSPADDYINGDGSGTPGDRVAPTDQDNHDPAFLNIFDLALKKTIDTGSISDNGVYSVGANITFNITVTNQGTDTAQNIEITDYLPCGLSYSLAPFNPGWTRTGSLATYTAAGPLAPGQSLIVPLILQISPADSCNPDPLDYINVAEISGADDDEGNTYTSDVDSDYDQIKNNDAGGNVNSPSDDVITGDGTGTPNDEVPDTDEDDQDPAELLVFDLALRKVVSPSTAGYPGPYAINDLIRFDITIYNQGNIDADTVRIVDHLPAGLSFTAGDNIGLNWVAGPGANQVQRTINMVGGDTLNAGEDTTVYIFLRVLHTSGGIQAYTNIAEITSATAIIDGLNVTMSGDADSPYDADPTNDAGGQVTSPADNQVFGNGNGTPGDGIASGDEDDQDPALVTIVDVALKKLISASTPGPYQYGDNVQFEITVTNQGTLALDSVEVTDYIPSGFTFGTNPDWTLSGSDATRVIRSRLDPAEDTVITINLVIAAESDLSKVDSAWINYAEVSQAFDTLGTDVSLLDIDSDLDNNPGNNAGGRPLSDADNYIDGDGTGTIGDGVDTTDQDNHDPALVSVVDVALRKIAADTLGDANLAFGDTIRFDIQIFNQGNVVIDSLTITDYIPEGFAYLPMFNPGWSGSYPSPQYGWGTSDDLLPGESDTISIYLRIIQVGEPNLAKYTNYAEISYASDTLGVIQSSNDSDSPLNTLDDDNAGGQPLSPADDDIDGNGSGAIGDGVASTDQDNHDPASVYPRIVDVALIKRIAFTNPGPFALGDTVMFDLKIINQGTISLDSVYLVDYIPAGFAFDAGLNPAWTLMGNQASTIVDETILPGQSTIVGISLIILKITDLSQVDSAWTNRAEITRIYDEDGNDVSGEDADSPLDNNPDNNPGGQPGSPADDEENGDGTGTPGDGVPGTDQDNADPAFVDLPDLALRKIIQDTLGDSQLNYGDTIKFGILLFNQGNIPVDSIRIEDSIPAGFSFLAGSLNMGWTLSGQDASYAWGQDNTLFPGESDTVCIYLTLNMVAPSAPGHWVNRAEITYFADTLGNSLDDIDSNPDNEQTNDPGGSPDTPSDDAIDGDGTGMPGDTSRTTDEDDEDPAGLKFYDLALVKQVAAGSTVTAYGDSVKFMLTIINQGTEPVDSIIITDTLPAGLMFDNTLAVNNIWTAAGNELTTTVRTRLNPGEDTVICLALRVLKNYDLSVAGSTWVNRAEISSAFDTLGVDISDQDIDSPLDENYGNNGGGQPESPADDEMDGNGTGPVGGPDSGTDQDNADPALVEVADLALRKVAMDTLGDNVLLFGDTVKIAIQIFNQGSIPVDSIVITDSLPAGLGFVTGPLNAGWVFNGSDYEYGWGTGDTLYPGESDTVCIYVIFQLGFPGTPETYTNLAEISEFFDTDGNPLDDVDSTPDDNQANDGGGEPKTGSDDPIDGDGTGMPGDTSSVTDEDDEDPLELGFFDLALRKVVNAGSTATAYGDTVKFDLTIFNQGSIPTDSVILTDSLPAGFSFDATIPGNAGWVPSGNKLTKAVSGFLLTGLEDTTVCLWLTVEQVLNPADHATAWINYAEISEAWLAGNNISILDIDSELNNIYGDNAGGQPDSPADDEVDGDGTGAIGDGVDTTDQDNADPARVEIVDLALRKIIMDTLGDATLEYGDTIKFAIHLFNQGNVAIDSLVVNDTLPNGFSYVNDPGLNAGWVFAGTEANYGWGTGDTLFPGESDTICIYLRLEMVNSGIPDFTNRAEISYAQDTTGTDRSNDDIDSPLNDNYGDNAGGQPESSADNEVGGDGTGVIGDGVAPTDQDNADPAYVEIVDLALRKVIMDTLGDATLEYGDTVKFAIHLFNQGNVAIEELVVNDTLPNGFSFVNDPALNAGWTIPFGNETSYPWGGSDTLNPGESDTICIYLRLEQVNTGLPDFTNRAEISYAEDLTGADRSNDDIDSPLNDNYGDNAGGQPESPADNEVDGDGTGTIGDGVAPTDQDNADPALVQVVDLALRKVILDTLGDATLEYGDTIKFAIHLFNQGNVPVEELTVTDTIPNGFSFVDNSLNTGWSLPAGNETQFVWGAGDTLNPGESDTICIYLRLEMILSGIPDFVNRAEISSATGFGQTDLSNSDIDSPLNGNYGDNAGGQPDSPADDEVEGLGTGAIGDGVDSTDQDNADPARVEVLDLALRKLLIPGPRMTVVYADTAEFVIEVINQGNVPATNIKITDSLPDGFVADAGVNPGWTMVNSTSVYSTYCYTLTDTLHPGDTARLNFYGIVESSEMQGAWINYAEITSVQDTTGADRSGDDIDSSPDGNVGGNDGGGQPESEADDETNGDGTGATGDGVASTDEDDEDPAALMLFNLALKKEIDGSTPGPYRYGDTVRFVVTVVNQGNIPATNIEVSDSIPAGFAFDAGLNPDWTGPGPVVTLVFTDTIAMGDTVTALLDLIVQPVADPMLRQNAWTNLAEISYAEDTSGNNTDTNLPDHDSHPDDNFTNDAGGRPESPADNYLNGNGQGQPGDGVAETDEDDADPALVEVFDLALVKQIDSAGTPLPYTYGDLIKYKLRVINQGNEPAVNIEVADYIPRGLIFDGPSNPEWSLINDSTAVTTIADTLFADGDTVLCIYLRLQPAADRNAWVNVAEISYAEDTTGADRSNDDADHVLDRDRTNNAGSLVNSPADDNVDGDGTGTAGEGIADTDGDNIDPAWLDVFDLALIKTTPHLVVQEGEVVDFYITVHNQGNIDAENIKVTDYIPLDMSLAASPGWTVLPPDRACYTIAGPLVVGDSITIQINLQVDDPAVNLPEGLYNYAEISSATDTLDTDYPDIDGDFDTDPGNDPGGNLFNEDDNNISGNGKRGEDEDNHDGAYVMVCKGYVCNNRVNVSFGDLCEIIVTGDDVIENPMLPSIHYRVTLRDASGKIVPDARLTRAHMGYCFTYSVDAPACPANSCWGTICVEDKAPPMIDCSPDTVLCFELSNLPSEGTVNDNCSGPVKVNVVSEQYIDYGCDSAFIQGVVKRRLIATDTWKNTVDCEKIYYVRRLNIEDLVCPRDTVIDCSLEVVNKVPFTHPSRSGAPTIEGIALWPNNVSCKVLTDYKDEISEVCGDGYKIFRTWTIVDWCGRRDTMCTQTIKVIDQTPPLAYDRTLPTLKADPHVCRAQIQLDTLAVSDCSKVIQTYSYPYLDEATGVIMIASGTLPARVWVTSGVTVIDVTLTDGCFNRSQNTITVKVVDETPPTPVCKEYTQVTVDPVSCWTVVKAKDLDNGSHDNCIKPLHFAVARMSDIEKARTDYLAKIEAECGLKEYKEHKAWYDQYIEDWINMYVFDDELHMDDCGENQVVLRVYEADSMPRLDPHIWKCGEHEWFCYNTYPSYRLVHNYHFFSTNPPASKDCDAGAPWLCKKASEKWFADRKNQFEFSRYYGTNDGSNFPQTRLYNDCMVKVIVDDKQPPVVDHLEDVTVYCDNAPAGTAYARQLCKHGEEFEQWPGPLSYQGETYGYYGGSDHIRRGHTDHQDPVYGCDHGDQWSPIYCHQWLYLDSYDQTGPVDPAQYFSTLVKFDKDRPARPLGAREFSITDNCRLDDTTMHFTDIGSVNGCGEGWFQRTWRIKDKCGNEAVAVQKVIIKHRSDFEVVFPADLEVTCDTENATDSSRTGKPEIRDDECEIIGVRYVDEISTIDQGDGACYKIIRTWTLIDWCIYDPNAHTIHPDVIVDDRLRANDTDRVCVFRNLKDNGDGFMKYVQIIKVFDHEAPVLNCRDTTICLTEGCQQGVNIPLEGADNCSEEVLYRLDITRPDGSTETRVNVNSISGNFTVGVYTIRIIGKDHCDNADTCTMRLTMRDCKEPTPYCLNGIATVVMPLTGAIEIWAKDLDRGSTDNCTANSALKFSFSSNVGEASRVFRCSDIPDGKQQAIPVDIWVTDQAGNQNYCRTYILLQDNGGQPGGVCKDTTLTTANINGKLYTEDKEGVEFATVELKGVGQAAIPSFKTGSDGNFAFSNIQLTGPVSIKALRDDNPMNGLSTLDLVLLQKHLLGTEKLKSPYKVIAADINNSQDINVVDLVELRKLILGIYDQIPGNTSWKFIPKSHSFTDVQNPWGYPTEEQLDKMQETEVRDFVGVKIGDLNSSAVPHSLIGTEVRGNDIGLTLETEDRVVRKGEEVSVTFRSPNFRGISGWQGTLHTGGLQYLGVRKTGKLDLTDEHIGRRWAGEGMLTMSWHHHTGLDLDEEAPLFTLVFRAGMDGRLSEMLRFGSQHTIAESYEGKGELGGLSLHFVAADGQTVASRSELYQNYPNPFDQRTVIGINLEKEGKGVLRILDITGRTLRSIERDWSKGYQEVWLDRREIGATGVLYYRFESEFLTASRKMMIVD